MSQQDGFTSGFIFGAIVGGAIGGIVGALVASRGGELKGGEEENLPPSQKTEGGENSDRVMETARQSLESKIAQLNSAIDDVRQQLSPVNGDGGDRE